MPRDTPFDPAAAFEDAVTAPRFLRVTPLSFYVPKARPEDGTIVGYKTLQSGTLDNIRVDVEEVVGEGLMLFSIRKAGTKIHINHDSIIKPGSMHIGNFDIGARDELRVSIIGVERINEVFFTAMYRY